MSDKKGRILVLDKRIDEFDLPPMNTYNASTEKEQVSVLNKLTKILSNFENIDNHVIFTDDSNVFFDALLDAKGSSQL